MVPAWTVTLSYIGYAAMLALGAICWLLVLFEYIVYGRVESGELGQRWLDFAHMLMRNLHLALWTGLALAVAAFVLAALPASDTAPAVSSHKAYQMKFGAFALCFLGLISLAQVRMGAFDADIASVAVFAWALWVIFSGWRAFAGQVAVTGPAGWWLLAIVDGLAVLVFGGFAILIKIQGFRMF
jgi:hypothetical protein